LVFFFWETLKTAFAQLAAQIPWALNLANFNGSYFLAVEI
jgi:hypothetical protein